jgi:hypothetical protein
MKQWIDSMPPEVAARAGRLLAEQLREDDDRDARETERVAS